MGTAILQGLLNKDKEETQKRLYTACVRSEASLRRLRGDIGGFEDRVTVLGAGKLIEAVRDAEIVMLGCVPGELDSLLEAPGLVEALQGKLVISLLAGVSTTVLAERIGKRGEKGMDGKGQISIGRVIPSIGAKIGDSVSLLARSGSLPEMLEQKVVSLFGRVGSVVCVSEKLMDDATAIGAACHALNMHALDAITDASVAEGFDRSTAMQLAAQSLRSSSNLFCVGGMTPEQLKAAMSTPKGITINAVMDFQTANVPSAIANAVRKAIRYARDM